MCKHCETEKYTRILFIFRELLYMSCWTGVQAIYILFGKYYLLVNNFW